MGTRLSLTSTVTLQQKLLRIPFSVKPIRWCSHFIKLTKEPFTSQTLSLSPSPWLISQNYKNHRAVQLLTSTPVTQSKTAFSLITLKALPCYLHIHQPEHAEHAQTASGLTVEARTWVRWVALCSIVIAHFIFKFVAVYSFQFFTKEGPDFSGCFPNTIFLHQVWNVLLLDTIFKVCHGLVGEFSREIPGVPAQKWHPLNGIWSLKPVMLVLQ